MVTRAIDAALGKTYTRVQVGFYGCLTAFGIVLLLRGETWAIIFASAGGSPFTVIALSILWQRVRPKRPAN
jgi:hypothetical protein